MREFATTYLKLFRLAVILAGIQVCFTGVAMAKIGIVKKIYIRDNPLSVEFDVSGKAPVKVIRISKTEVLVAIKNVSLAKTFTIQGKNHPSIASVNVEALEGNVVAVVVVGKQAYGKLDSRFNKNNTRLMVSLGEEKAAASRKPAAAAKETPSKESQEKPEVKVMPKAKDTIAAKPTPPKKSDPPAANLPSQPKPLPKIAAPVKKDEKNKRLAKEAEKVKMATAPVYVPPKRSKSEFKGDISDLYRGPDPKACEAKQVQNALLLIKKELYKEAYEVLDQYMIKENFSCLEQVYFLKAYVYYKGIEEGDFTRLIKAERMFQDAVVSYPKSKYLPFAYTAMGMIQAALKNMSAAEGYFNIVHQGYKDYTGMPEVQYHLAMIFDEKGYTDKALRLYKKVFQSPLDNSYITDAGVGYGKALFNKRQYFDALSIFNYVIKNDVKKVYEGPDLLLFTADANFELGLSKGARDNYIRVMNLFPDIPNKDMVLSKVGDAYGLENNEEKAKKNI
jgi:TolA-binding protein